MAVQLLERRATLLVCIAVCTSVGETAVDICFGDKQSLFPMVIACEDANRIYDKKKGRKPCLPPSRVENHSDWKGKGKMWITKEMELVGTSPKQC